MREEILEVVAKYVEIDLGGGAVRLEIEDRMTALVANLPIERTLPCQAIYMKKNTLNLLFLLY